MLGDLHYSGHLYLSKEQFKFAVHEVMKSKQMRQLYTQVPILYMLDDHDIGMNNADGNHLSTKQATAGFADVVPGPLKGAFTIAGARFIQIDSRTQLNTDEKTTVFGRENLEWIKQEISQARQLNQNVILLLSFSWKSEREFNNRTNHEKEELAEHIMKL